jgi:hypothetical protein
VAGAGDAVFGAEVEEFEFRRGGWHWAILDSPPASLEAQRTQRVFGIRLKEALTKFN